MLPEGKGMRAVLFGENGMFDMNGKFHEGGTSGIIRWKDMQVLNELNEVGLSNNVFKRMYEEGRVPANVADIRKSLEPTIAGMDNPKQWAKAFIRTVPVQLEPGTKEPHKIKRSEWLDAQRDKDIYYRSQADPVSDARLKTRS